MARPLVSVASVRVSLTVMTKQPTDRGACALCSTWLHSAVIVARDACYDPPMRWLDGASSARCACSRSAWPLVLLSSSRAATVCAGAARIRFPLDAPADALGRADAEDADARREDRPAHRSVVRVQLPEHRQRHVRRAGAARARLPRRRLSRVRRRRAGAVRAAELRLRHGDSRPAVLRRVADQPAAGDVDGAAAEHGRLRDRRRLPHLRRDHVSAADGDGRDAAGDDDVRLVREEARITGVEARALGVQVNFAPVADVNNNPRNPVINTRSYGEDPARVAALVARVRRRRARRRHDRDDQAFSRARRHRRRQPPRPAGRSRSIARGSTRSSCVPFRARHRQRRAGGDGGAHRAAGARSGAVDAGDVQPADSRRSAAARAGVRRPRSTPIRCRWTPSPRLVPPDEGAVRAFLAGADQILHSPDPIAAFNGLKAAVESGRMLAGATRRVGRRACCAPRRRSACTRSAPIDLDAVPAQVGGRAHQAVGAGGVRALDHARQGRSPPGAADGAARRAGAVSVGPRLPVGLADRGAEPDVHPGAEEALAAGDGDRSVGSHAAVGARSGARGRAALRRDRRVGVRARDVGERPAGSCRRSSCGCCSDLARHDRRGRARRSSPTFFGNPYTAVVRAGAAGDAAHLRFLRSARARRRPRDRRRDAASAAGCRSRCPACFRVGHGLDPEPWLSQTRC